MKIFSQTSPDLLKVCITKNLMNNLIFIFTLLCCFYNVSTFWTPCEAGGREPDAVTSPHCKF